MYVSLCASAWKGFFLFSFVFPPLIVVSQPLFRNCEWFCGLAMNVSFHLRPLKYQAFLSLDLKIPLYGASLRFGPFSFSFFSLLNKWHCYYWLIDWLNVCTQSSTNELKPKTPPKMFRKKDTMDFLVAFYPGSLKIQYLILDACTEYFVVKALCYHIMWLDHVMELDDWLRGDRWLVRRVRHIRRSISTQGFAAFWLRIRCRNAPHTSSIHQVITNTMKNSWFWRFVPLALRKCTHSVRGASGIHSGTRKADI